MNAITRWLRSGTTILAAFLVLAGPARGQAWPERPVRLLVPLGPGSGADVTARLLADRLSQRWHQPVTSISRSGRSPLRHSTT